MLAIYECKNKKVKHKAFTLIEVLIVVFILGTLAIIAIPMLQGMTIKAKFAEMFTIVREYEIVADSILMEHGWGNEGFTMVINSPDLNHPGSVFQCFFGTNLLPEPHCYLIRVQARYSPTLQDFIGTRIVYENGQRYWWVSDNHPWSKYLKAILPKESLDNPFPV